MRYVDMFCSIISWHVAVFKSKMTRYSEDPVTLGGISIYKTKHIRFWTFFPYVSSSLFGHGTTVPALPVEPLKQLLRAPKPPGGPQQGLDLIHECIKLRLEQRPAGKPSLLSIKQVPVQGCTALVLHS